MQNVVKILEDNQIFQEKYRIKSIPFQKINRYAYKMRVNGYEVEAIFNKNLETDMIVLNSAWVVTK